jgi:phosphoheptose isomerase
MKTWGVKKNKISMENTLKHNIAAAIATAQALESFVQPMQTAAEMTLAALQNGNKLLVCGNGGSAADAMHLATEFVCRFSRDRDPYPAICLNVSGGDMTAIGNDYDYGEVFARQVRAFGKPGDIFIPFTTSGRSKNIRLALVAANEIGMQSVAFLGRDGGDCKGLASVEFLVQGPDTARIQEAQKLLLHTLCEMVDNKLVI